MRKCKVIAVTNQKGGVGKTTTTANVAIGLERYGCKVLIVEWIIKLKIMTLFIHLE